jgi:Fe-S-cluster containining protein
MQDEPKNFYLDVDAAAGKLESVHAERLQCGKGCSSCCVDGITVFEVEAENIRSRHGDLLEHGTPHDEGVCAFLDEEGACRIYEDRPYVCRTQGLPLRWVEEVDEGYVEYRDICPLNDDPEEPLESLSENKFWTIGEFEGRLARLQQQKDAEEGQRTPLRELFLKHSK